MTRVRSVLHGHVDGVVDGVRLGGVVRQRGHEQFGGGGSTG